MAVTGQVWAYDCAEMLLTQFSERYSYETTPVIVSLHSSAYEPDFAHQYDTELAGEASGGNYARKKLQGKLVRFDTATQRFQLTATSVNWPKATFEVRYAVIQFKLGAFGDLPTLLAYVDFGEDMRATNGTFTLSWAQGMVMEIEGVPADE